MILWDIHGIFVADMFWDKWYSHSWYCWYVHSWYDTPISCIFLSWYCSHSWYVWGYSWDSSWLVSILLRWSTECPKSRCERRHSICPYLEGGIGTNKLVKLGEDNRSIDGYPLVNIQKLWKITTFNRSINYTWAIVHSFFMLYQRVIDI